MVDKRLFIALIPLALLAACKDEVANEADSRSARGEVLEGTISDAMLPLDRVRSEPPLEDPEAFAEAQEKATEGAPGAPAQAGEAPVEGEDEPVAAEEGEAAVVPPPEPAD
jgi:hypothetical protein